MIATLLDRADEVTDRFAALDGRFLLPALALQLANLALRSLAWRNVLAAAYPGRQVAYPSIAGAYVAGVGMNTFLPGRAAMPTSGTSTRSAQRTRRCSSPKAPTRRDRRT